MSKNLRNQVYFVVNSLSINNITINAPQGSNYTLTLPTTDGTNGQVLTTDGSGVLSWSDANNIPGGSYTGTGLIVRQTSPTLVTPTIGVASGTSLNLTATSGNPALTFNSVVSPRRIVLATGGGNNFQYYGFGLQNDGIKYNVNSSTDNHYFYAGATSSTETPIAWFSGAGSLVFPTTVSKRNRIALNGNEGNFQFTGLGINTGEMIYSVTNSTLNHNFYCGTGGASAAVLFRVIGSGGFNSFGSGTIAGSLTISTPLGVASGGTGTGTIGTPGQYAIVNAGATGYSFTSGPGGGGVTSVGLAGDSTFNNIFTITTSSSNPIVNSGILTINVTNFTGTGNLVLATSPTLTTPVLGVATATSLTASGTVTAATLNATGLTASKAVFTDVSKNLISVDLTGTGNVVLATSPTLVTPNIGVATATSLTASGTVTAATLNATGLTALGVVLTDVSKNLTVPANGANGTVLTIVGGVPAWSAVSALGAITATTITASGTVTAATLNATGLTASKAVFTDGSKNLISTDLTGTGNVVLATSPTLVTPNIGFATATGLLVTGGSSSDIGINLNTVIANRRVALASGVNEYQYTGFGLSANALKYSVASSSADHIFYRGETSSSETELFKVKGGGGFTSSGNSSITGNLTLTGQIYGGTNISIYAMSGNSGWPNGADTICGNWTTVVESVGLTLNTNSGTGVFTNNLLTSCFVRITWYAKRASNAFGSNRIWIRENASGAEHGSVTSGGVDWMTTTAVMGLPISTSFTLYGFQDSGTGNDFQASNSKVSIQLYFFYFFSSSLILFTIDKRTSQISF